MAKLGVSSDIDLLLHESPSVGLDNILRSDAAATLFLKE